MKIDAIKDGIVIDHITAGRGMTLYNYLGLDALDCTVALIKNVSSSKMGKKDIIKIDADFGVDTDVLGYVDPGVTVNVIKNGEIVEKKKIELPEILNGVIRCKNPRCITSTEHSLPQRFRLTDPSGPVYRCVWCEARAKTDFDNK
ncbi:MAG: aspartate carbamoyltransferase regulatory subunit [Clostridia bacterium]|nr:aspartate carbamoyltransferase regulatory subunit [Clostridia bacterium]MBR6915557.1 aspartate carbamoyltransferase regulatory subunit [Clostridia bacterium]MBR7033207.1 aspartate carbamoyltransferase regulatory subunit [Clostridia bacterium]